MEPGVASVLQLLNSVTKPSIRSFQDRLKLQKLVYLARQVGFDTGFSFSWYIHGPYSPSLTNFIYSADELGILGELPPVPKTEKDKLELGVQRLRKLLGPNIENPKYLELLASVWYVLPQGPVDAKRKETLAKMLHQIKPDFGLEEYSSAADVILAFRKAELRPS